MRNSTNAAPAASDLRAAQIPSSPEAPRGLQEIYDVLVVKAETAMTWYETRQRQKKLGARYTRGLAILLGSLTAIIPSVLAFFPDRVTFMGVADFPVVRLNPIATITGVLAATMILFDKFYGFSSSWMRFITTHQEIQTNLEEFRIGWHKQILKLKSNNPPSDEQIIAVYDFLGAFLKSVNDSVRNETQSWVNEFKGALADIDKTVEAQKSAAAQAASAPAAKGGLTVTVGDYDTLDEPQWTLQLDNRKAETKVGQSSASIALLEPGIYRVRVAGVRKQKPVAAESTVVVKAGEVAPVKVDKLG